MLTFTEPVLAASNFKSTLLAAGFGNKPKLPLFLFCFAIPVLCDKLILSKYKLLPLLLVTTNLEITFGLLKPVNVTNSERHCEISNGSGS